MSSYPPKFLMTFFLVIASEKTQGPQKKNQEPKIASKNLRSWEKTQAVATLDRNQGKMPKGQRL